MALGALSAPGLGILSVVGGLGFAGPAIAATSDDDNITVNLDVQATISIACDSTVTMAAITGTGRSAIADTGGIATGNVAGCNVKTNNTAGYRMDWQASSGIQASGHMINANGDLINAYTVASSGTPETWSIANNTSEWGAKLGASSEGYNGGVGGTGYTYPNNDWGSADTYAAGKFMNVSTQAGVQIMSKSSETDVDGEFQYLVFGAEVGSAYLQPTGTYSQEVTVTATTL